MKNYVLIFFVSLLAVGCQSQNMVVIQGKKIPIFDSSSEYFHDSIKARLNKMDTTLLPLHFLAYTHFIQRTASFNPQVLDDKASEMYEANEQGDYEKALEKGREILKDSPNNITALKEIGYAYKKLGKMDSVQIYFTLMVKAIEGAKLSGDGGVDSPYVLTNWFELRSLIEATSGLYASKKALFKDSKGRLIGLAMVESPKMGRFGVFNHWMNYLKPGDYQEGDFFSEQDLKTQLKIDYQGKRR